MRVERRQGRRVTPRQWHQGKMGPLQFDGYSTIVHFTAEDGTDVRVIFERHESSALAAYIQTQLDSQRERVKSMACAYAELSDSPEEPS